MEKRKIESFRSAHVEAMSHLTKGLEALKTLPQTPERGQQEKSKVKGQKSKVKSPQPPSSNT